MRSFGIVMEVAFHGSFTYHIAHTVIRAPVDPNRA